MKQCMTPVIAALCFVSCSLSLAAQVPQGQVLGAITDPAGGAIADASVLLESKVTGIRQTAISNREGLFIFDYLNSGHYRLTIDAPGFNQGLVSEIEIEAGDKKRVAVQLRVGAVSTTVDVASGVSKLETESATVGSVISKTEVENLPLDGRDFSQLATIEPGVVKTGSYGIWVPLSTSIQVGGTGSGKNYYTTDGMDNYLDFYDGPATNPSVESIQEFRLDRSLASAEFGRGGAQLQVVTRSGGNAFHGTVWEYLRNSALNGGNYFTHTSDELRRHQYGANLGGPILKNRLFFFMNWEGQRQGQNYQQFGTVLTERMRKGDFSELPTAVRDPVTGAVFANNQIPATRFNPAMVDLMNAVMPSPNRAGIVTNRFSSGAASDNRDQYVERLDFRISDKDTLLLRGTTSPRSGQLTPPGVSQLPLLFDMSFGNYGGALVHIWKPDLVSESKFSLTPVRTNYAPPANIPSGVSTEIPGVGGTPSDHLALVSFVNFDALGQGGTPYKIRFADNEFQQTVSWFKGKHLLKAGITARWLQRWNTLRWTKNTWPFLTYNGSYSGSDAADFLLGVPASGFAQMSTAPRHAHYEDFSGFIQDDWKPRRDLSISLGLRYDVRSRFAIDDNIWTSFDPSSGKEVIAGNTINNPQASPGLVDVYGKYFIAGSQTSLPARALAYGDYNNFAPRIGFAWRPLGGNRTVVRGGYGIYYVLPQANYWWDAASNTPFGGEINVNNTVPVPSLTATNFLIGNGTALAYPPLSVWFRDPRNRDGYIQQASLRLSQELPWGVVAEAGVSHERGLKLEQAYFDINQPKPGSGDIQDRRPYPDFVNLYKFVDGGFNRYSALELLLRRASVHYTLQFSYTWSKNIASGPIIDSRDGHLFDGPQNYIPSVVKFHYVVDLPFGKGRRLLNRGGITDAALGGWTLSGISIPYASGSPLTPVWSGDVANVGVYTVRPDRIGSGSAAHPTTEAWFDPSAFVAPAQYTFGNSGTGILSGPSSSSVDLALHKNFAVTEKTRLQFRSEFFNAFNHPNLGTPNLTVNSLSFARITSVNSAPRVIQFALRLSF